MTDADDGTLDTAEVEPAEIESLMRSVVAGLPATVELPPDTQGGNRSRVEWEAVESMTAVAPEFALSKRLAEARRYELEPFDVALDMPPVSESPAIEEAEFELQIELGRAELPADEADLLREGAVVTLDKLAGDPVDIVIGGQLIARGEVLVLDDKFCVRIAEILGVPAMARLPTELVHS